MKQHKKLLFAVLAAGIVAGMSGCSTVGNLATSELVAPGLAIGGASLGRLRPMMRMTEPVLPQLPEAG